MSRQHNPPYPGEVLREVVLPALGLSVTEAAESLGVSRVALSRVLNGHAAISPEMALRLEKWLGTDRGGRADLWLAHQAVHDLWHTRRSAAAKIRKVKRARARSELHRPAS
jgi:addiction module HigA family antidote